MNNYSIEITQPYDLHQTLYSGQAFRWEYIEDTKSDQSWHQGFIKNRRLRIRQSETHIHIKTTEKYTETEISDVISYLRLDDNMETIYAKISNDKYIISAIKKYQGLHILRQDPWETLITFICSSNNNIPRIRQLVNSMSLNFGQKGKDEFGVFNLFPSSFELYDAGEQSLRDIGLGFRAKYVSAAAELAVQKKINVNELINKSYQYSLGELIKIPGVGDKVANCILLFSLDKLEAFPVDVWIKRVLKEVYINKKNKISDTKIRSWAQEKFGPYSGYVNQYLFHNRRLFEKSIMKNL